MMRTSPPPSNRAQRTRACALNLKLFSVLFFAVAATLLAQDLNIWITGQGSKPALAVVDFRGAGTQPFMSAFNSTLFNDLQGSGLFDMKSKSMFPLNNPQRPEDLRPADGGQGYALVDWAGAPVNASHLLSCSMVMSTTPARRIRSPRN
jgi:hypothetical protein